MSDPTETASREGVDEIERWVLDTCHQLGLKVTAGEHDFFDAGATSITATRLIAQVEKRYGEDALPPDDLFEKSTIRDIAATILRNRG